MPRHSWKILFSLCILFSVATSTPAQLTWTQECGPGPQSGYYAQMAYDSARNQVVLFGGVDSSFTAYPNDTWTWNGTSWTKHSPVPSPPGRAGFGMAYDAARGRVVIFGGSGASGFFNDTWEWDGTNWMQKTNGPGFLLHVGMAYDAARQQVVLYGGSVGTPNPLANTWVYEGNAWTQKSPANTPGPRSNFRMAYDAARQQIVMFGGYNGSTDVNETWVWDGTNWAQKFPSTPPSARQDFGIAYDSNRQRVVLFSGIRPTPNPPPDNNTYEWDGTNWTQDTPAQNPDGNGRGGVSMAYDAAHSEVVMFGGVDTTHVFTDTVVFGVPTASSCLGQQAAGQAKSLLGKPYFEGGKGYDMSTKNNLPPFPYVSLQTISNGYLHCDINGCPPGVTIGEYPDLMNPGIDCAGLVLWSYDTAAGASTTDDPQRNPIPRKTDQLSIDQYYNSRIISRTANVPADLQPGDLLFFRYKYKLDQKGNPVPVTHVAMYVGQGEVIEAYSDAVDPNTGLPIGVIRSSLMPDSNNHTRANFDRYLRNPELFLCSDPTVGTKPCFQAYGRPNIAPQFKIRFGTQSPVTLTVIDPDAYTITPKTLYATDREVGQEVPGQLYYNVDTNGDDEVIGRILKVGNYFVQVAPKPGATSSDVYSLTVTTDAGTVTLAESVPISQIPPLGYGIMSTGNATTPFIPIAIDVKPGSAANAIKLKNSGTIPVAILSNVTFNSFSQVVASSLTFGPSGNEQSLAFCDSTSEDVNGDGLPDLVCHFYTQKTGFQIGDAQGILKGWTGDGQLIRGTDTIQIMP